MPYSSATALTVKDIGRTPVSIAALQNTDSTNGNKFACTPGKTFVRLKNPTGGPLTATFETPGSVDGLAISDLPVAVAAGADVVLDGFTGSFLQPGTSDVYVTFSGAGMQIDVWRLANE